MFKYLIGFWHLVIKLIIRPIQMKIYRQICIELGVKTLTKKSLKKAWKKFCRWSRQIAEILDVWFEKRLMKAVYEFIFVHIFYYTLIMVVVVLPLVIRHTYHNIYSGENTITITTTVIFKSIIPNFFIDLYFLGYSVTHLLGDLYMLTIVKYLVDFPFFILSVSGKEWVLWWNSVCPLFYEFGTIGLFMVDLVDIILFTEFSDMRTAIYECFQKFLQRVNFFSTHRWMEEDKLEAFRTAFSVEWCRYVRIPHEKYLSGFGSGLIEQMYTFREYKEFKLNTGNRVVNYNYIITRFQVVTSLNQLINSSYNVVLVTYALIIALYSIYRGVNYSSVTKTVNTILLVLFGLSVLKLIVGGPVWSLSSDIKINNLLMPLNLLSFYYDNLTFIFLLTIYAISFVVHRYQFAYLDSSPFKENFLITFNIFVLSMVGVVSTSNWPVLLFAWEILGLSSFLLIGFYKNKPTALKSALKAFTFNKLSDLFLILAFMFYYFSYGTFYFTPQQTLTPAASYITTFVLLTAFIKSAQFCFYFWLPDSMEAPIPASALIHSATLVSAGIYLVLRLINILELCNTSQYLLFFVPSITMVVASLIAYNQTDIKKLLAYSTIANCGFIYFLIFLKAYKLALIYFVIHGLVKSFSFIVAGELITANNHAQDMRKWVNLDAYRRLQLLFLGILLLLLSAMPISLMYVVKTGLFDSNYTSSAFYLPGSIAVLLYTLNSYLYGLKLIIFFINKNVFYKKHRTHVVQNSDLNVSTNLLFVTYLSLLVCIVVISSFYINITGPLISWQWLLSFLIITVGFVYSTIRNELIYGLVIILLVGVSAIIL